jgi:hypothetical protein
MNQPEETMRTAALPSIALVLACAVACSTGDPADPNGPPGAGNAAPSADGTNPTPFEPESPTFYVAKVKNVLVGLPPTDDEITAVKADPSKLKDLIDGWMKLPQYADKMRVFFELAFQQTQVTLADFADQTYPRQSDVSPFTGPLLLQNAKESFARTVLELIDEGRPFTDVTTTERFMMTPGLMEFYAFLDAWQVDDAGNVQDRFALANPKAKITLEAAKGKILLDDTVNPSSANFLHFYNPAVGTSTISGCDTDPIVFNANAFDLHDALHGVIPVFGNPKGGPNCSGNNGGAASSVLQTDDFAQWKMVTIRPPKAGEQPTALYDVPTLRAATELVLTVPRVGFFSTPAFFANWQTNTSNQMRVTINQTLIVALGAAIDGTDTTVPKSTPGLDAAHASEPACVGCHQTLDPTRSILGATYSWNYHQQTEKAFGQQKGLFAFQGVIKDVASAQDLGATLGQHPLFAPAWVQKLCYYVNSQKCETDDPEFLRIVDVFKSSGYSWSALVKELLSSPLTTYATPTETTTKDGQIVAVARRDHFCAALNARLGFTDICGLDNVGKKGPVGAIPQIVSGLPSDGYGRGAIVPVLPNAPTLFYRAAVENICEGVAAMVIDVTTPVAGQKQWSSSQIDPALADFVHLVMGLPAADPRASDALSLLKDHFTQATEKGASASDALKSTFVVSCLAPSTDAIGL